MARTPEKRDKEHYAGLASLKKEWLGLVRRFGGFTSYFSNAFKDPSKGGDLFLMCFHCSKLPGVRAVRRQTCGIFVDLAPHRKADVFVLRHNYWGKPGSSVCYGRLPLGEVKGAVEATHRKMVECEAERGPLTYEDIVECVKAAGGEGPLPRSIPRTDHPGSNVSGSKRVLDRDAGRLSPDRDAGPAPAERAERSEQPERSPF